MNTTPSSKSNRDLDLQVDRVEDLQADVTLLTGELRRVMGEIQRMQAHLRSILNDSQRLVMENTHLQRRQIEPGEPAPVPRMVKTREDLAAMRVKLQSADRGQRAVFQNSLFRHSGKTLVKA